MDTVDKFGNFLTDDWKKIPQNLRYIFLVGTFLVFTSWLLDHWLPNRELPYKYFGVIDIRGFCFTVGFSLIFLGTMFTVLKQFYLFGIVIFYRRKYSVDNIDKTYHLGWFNEKLMLFDNKKKLYYHVHPWETAQDLLFVGRGWQFEVPFTEGGEYCYSEEGDTLKTKGYKNGGSLTTQR